MVRGREPNILVMVGMKSVTIRTRLLERTIPWPMIPATVIKLTPRVNDANGK